MTSNTRTGRAALSVQSSEYLRLGFALTGTTIVIGAGIRWGIVSAFQRPFRTWASANSRSGISLAINASGQLTVGYGGVTVATASTAPFGTTLWTSPDIEPSGTYVHYDLKAVLSSTATGSWALRRNGQVLQSQSSVITLAGSGDVITALITEGGTSTAYNVDDIYICDGSGSDSNDFLGPVRVQRLAPDANDSVAWTPNAGTNWSRLSEAGPDDDTTYVSASTAPLTDRFTLADLPASAAIIRGVRVTYRARKEDAATVETRALIRSGATDALGPLDALDTTYRYYPAYFPTDPATGVGWTPSGVNALVGGVRRVT